MPKMKGVWRSQWENCDRCGFPHPFHMLTRQKGLLVCHCHGCYDNLTVELRARSIASILADGKEGDNPKAEKKSETDAFELEF